MEDEKYTLEQRICLYDAFVKFSSAKKAQKLFRLKYPNEFIPSKSAIHKLVNNVRRKGMLIDLKKKPTEKASDIVSSKHKSGASKTAAHSAAKLLELQLQAIREKVLAAADTDEDEISVKVEPEWMKESEDTPPGDSEMSSRQAVNNIKMEPVVSLVEAPAFVTVKNEPEEDLESEGVISGNEAEECEGMDEGLMIEDHPIKFEDNLENDKS